LPSHERYRRRRGGTRYANLGRLDKLSPQKLDPLINGDVFALHALWCELGIDKALQRTLRSARRSFDAEALMRAMVFNRLCEPTASWAACAGWKRSPCRPCLKPSPPASPARHGRADGQHVDPVESELSQARSGPLVDRDLSVVFYDLTTVRIHGEGEVEEDLRAFGMNKETGGIARQFVLGVVQTAEGLPLMHTVHPGNVAETKTLQAMLATVLQRFPIERVILVADRGLLSLDNIGALTGTRQGGRAHAGVHPRRAGAPLWRTGRDLPRPRLRRDGPCRGRFAGHRLIVAHDPLRAAEQGDAMRRARIAELEAMAEKMVGKLDAQDAGATAGRRASDRGAYSRFTRAVAEAEMTRFLKPT
jgi:hypothetical protein